MWLVSTVASNGPLYFGFVLGAPLPAADRLALAWDQCASSQDISPVCAAVEKVAAGWLLEILDLLLGSSVGFGTSATAGTIACLAAARRSLLARAGWNLDRAVRGCAHLGEEGGPPARLRHGARDRGAGGRAGTYRSSTAAAARDPEALAQAMNSDAAYFTSSADSQKNLTLEFSRRPRGIAIWAALRSIGRDGLAALVERHCDYALQLARRLEVACGW